MKKSICAVIIALAICLANSFCFTVSLAEETFPAYIKGNESGAKIRSEPSAASKIIGNIQEGEYVTATGRKGDWYKVSTGGYVYKNNVSYVTPKDSDEVNPKLLWDAEYASINYKYFPTQAIGVEQYDYIGSKGATMHSSIGTGFTIDSIDDASNLNDLFSRLGIGGITMTQDETVGLHAGTRVYVYCLVNAGNAVIAVVQVGGTYGYVYANYLEMLADE